MKIQQLIKRKQLLATVGFIALGLIVGLAGLMVAVLPQKSKSQDLDAQIVAAQAKLMSLKVGGHRGPAIKAADLFQLARAMPDTPDMPGILVDLADAASRSKVSLVNITPGAPIIEPDGSTAYPLKVVADGSWRQIAGFMKTLRTEVVATQKKLTVTGRLFVVDSVALAPTSASGGLEATLNANAFTYGVPVPVVTDTTGTGTTTTTTTPAPAPGSTQAAGATGSTG